MPVRRQEFTVANAQHVHFHVGSSHALSADFIQLKRLSLPLAGIVFPNLPYLIDGPVRLSQHSTIVRYATEQHPATTLVCFVW